ncbi:hypothetical protein [Vreelandella nanhaiensis]|uniref:Uncharacterized protein n=1 Tax=Vreelandella nanhaiensis TaxID=1258546 RepID=A0A3S0YJM3_9GAMM|nr:hypothetical protein [Halomonas nanhaiensis]RUR31821.1 hypothetical protein ELY38_10290 [Halomonas nanhaiensis]
MGLSTKYDDITEESMECRALFQDRLVVLGSSEFKEKCQIYGAEGLLSVPLLYLETEETGWAGWKERSDTQALSQPRPQGVSVNNYEIVLQAPQDGMGAILGWESLTAN